MRSLGKSFVMGAAAALLAGPPARAAVLKPLNLEELTLKAERIFSGTVIAIEKGRVAAGGGTLPTVTYRVEVDRALAGVPDKAGSGVTEIRMIGDLEEIRRDGLVRFRNQPPRPDIEVGERYLFFVTAPGPAGLSTTVGLGQGCFRLSGDRADEDAVNQYHNVGLFRGMSVAAAAPRGPVKYSLLATWIESLRVRK